MTFWRDCWQRLVLMLHLCVFWICCILCHFKWFMLLNATLWLTVTHTVTFNEQKLADWSKWVCITLWICFCSLLSSNCEVSAGRLHCSIITFTQNTPKSVKNSLIEIIVTNLLIGMHTLRVFAWYFEKIGRKGLFRCFIYVFVSICSFSWSLLTIYVVECNVVAYCLAYN